MKGRKEKFKRGKNTHRGETKKKKGNKRKKRIRKM